MSAVRPSPSLDEVDRASMDSFPASDPPAFWALESRPPAAEGINDSEVDVAEWAVESETDEPEVR